MIAPPLMFSTSIFVGNPGATPVSYTHLDVYKRQGISTSNGEHTNFRKCIKEFQISNNHFSVSVLAIPPSRYHTLVDNYVLLQF